MARDSSKHLTVFVHETLSIKEVSKYTGVTIQELEEYLALGLLGSQPVTETTQFSYHIITRVNKISRLRHDLELDLRSMDLILDLLEKIDDLESEVRYLKKRLSNS